MRKDYAQTAEGLGYDYLLVYDHVPGAHPERERKLTGPYTHEHPFHEGGAGGHQRFWRGRGDLDMTAPYRTPLAAAIGAVGTERLSSPAA